MDLKKLLVTHTVTWSRRDSFCENQYADIQPEEMPTMPVKVNIHQIEEPKKDTGFAKFNFDSWEDVING